MESRLVNVCNDTPMYVYPAPDIVSDSIVRDNNFWEFEIFEAWKEHFPTEGLMLDIGCNIGNHSLMFNRSFPNLKIYAFDMHYKNFEYFQKNTKDKPNITSFNVGVSDRLSIIGYNDDLHNHGGTSISEDGQTQNLAIKLDDFPFTEKVKFIKIDIEGHEKQAFFGMRNILLTHKPLIWTEDLRKDAVPYLKELGYNVIKSIDKSSDYLLKHNYFSK